MISKTNIPLKTVLEEVCKCSATPEGTKFDSQKNRLDLLDWEALEGLGAVLTFGASKYSAHNWRAGLPNSRIVAALLRHLSAIQRGELTDTESQLPHIDHIGCCWMFLSSNLKSRPDLNNLFAFQATAKPGLDSPKQS